MIFLLLLLLPLGTLATVETNTTISKLNATKPTMPPMLVRQLNKNNLNGTLHTYEVVLINFYADWCPYSKLLTPIYEQAAAQLAAEVPGAAKVKLARVDCVKEFDLAQKFKIRKYPTIWLVFRGQPLREEYRGQRSSDALVAYVKKQLKPAIKVFQLEKPPEQLDERRRIIFGYFSERKESEVRIYEELAERYKHDCDFYMCLNAQLPQLKQLRRLPGYIFRPDKERTHGFDEVYVHSPWNADVLGAWVQQKCWPMVSEVDFGNVEELIEQGLPLLLLFHQPQDVNSVKDFKSIVEMQLLEFREQFNFGSADGAKFEHSILHLNKTLADLPLIAIDSLRTMHPFENFKDMYVPGKLKHYLQEFIGMTLREKLKMADHLELAELTTFTSTFKDLGPSKHRYTLLQHDEL